MKLLFDENLSRKLVTRLSDLFPGSSHASTEGLLHKPDADLWEHAKAGGFAIVTAHADFFELAARSGHRRK